MPIYEYRCKKCDTVFEKLVVSGTIESPPCPSCSSKDTHKIMSAAGISMGTHRDPACVSRCSSAQSGCASGHCPMSQ